MADVKWQIEFINSGESAQQVAEQANSTGGTTGGGGSTRLPGPSDRVAGPKKSELGRDLETAVQKVANVFGVGGLTGTAIELRRAFSGLFHAVTAAEKAVESKRRADVGGAKTGDIKGPPAPPDTAPSVPGIPSVGTFERQRAKGEIDAPPVSRAVGGGVPNVGWFERTAAKGSVAAPPVAGSAVPAVPAAGPVVGPAAGAGSAASGMARLAAVAGPAALAVAGLTAAVAAGAFTVKKVFDTFASEADRLSGYSAQLSAATARSDIRAEFADMRRAARIGPGLARVENTTSKAETAMADLWTAILEQLLKMEEKFEPLIDLVVDIITVTTKSVPTIADTAGKIAPVITPLAMIPGHVNEIVEMMRWIIGLEKRKEQDKDDDLDDPFMAAFLDRFAGGMDQANRLKAIRAAKGRP